jgi:hypothetical protein
MGKHTMTIPRPKIDWLDLLVYFGWAMALGLALILLPSMGRQG